MLRSLLLLAALFIFGGLGAQQSHRVEVEVEGYEGEFLTLANYLLNKQYIIDTAYREDTGNFVFESDTNALETGIYIVVLAPDNDYFQVLIDEENQHFSLATNVENLGEVKVKGSKGNDVFYDYLSQLAKSQEKAEPLRKVLSDSLATDADKEEAEAKLNDISDKLTKTQDDIMRKDPASFMAAIIKTNRPEPTPEFTEITDEEARRTAQWEWLQEHYFDHIDLRDDRLLHTPFLFERMDNYVSRLTVQHPDSMARAIDRVLARMDPQSDLFKYSLIHFTNSAARSPIVGMDALYIYMVDNYYSKGRAYWADEEQVVKMETNVEEMRPLLIGKPAPDLKLKTRAGDDVNLYGIDAKYTVLYFWAFDCGHCKKSTPVMKEFFEKWNSRGVEVISICTKQNQIEKCWDYVDSNEIGDWMHLTDRYGRFYKAYHVRSTPSIFVLDKDKKILIKRIGAGQLDQVLTNLEKRAENADQSDK